MQKYLLLQTINSSEVRAAQVGAMLADPSPEIIRCSIDELSNHSEKLKDKTAMPVGSVEFLRMAFYQAGVDEPENLSYHDSIIPFLGREVVIKPAKEVSSKTFVKPVSTKLFTGFVYDKNIDIADLDEHDQEQYKVFMKLPGDTPIWTSQPVTFLGEWRYYIQKQKIIGVGRYDPDGPDDAPEPDPNVINRIVEAIPLGHPYALDVGTFEDGSTAVVEINDAWAIGLYGKSLKPKEYLSFLTERWLSFF